jgi:hypothetical protein
MKLLADKLWSQWEGGGVAVSLYEKQNFSFNIFPIKFFHFPL